MKFPSSAETIGWLTEQVEKACLGGGGGFRPGEVGKTLLPDGTREGSRNQESEQSSATIVPQLSMVADIIRR